MSRIGLQSITIPDGVQVSFNSGTLKVKGPKGELSKTVHEEINVTVKDNSVKVEPISNTKFTNMLWGTYASHAKNMIKGVTEGYKKELEVQGVGYRAEMKGSQLILNVGFSHPVEIDVPEGVKVDVKDNIITIEGFDKEAVGLFASKVRLVKKPEPYKGKGIRYTDEIVRQKQGKKAETE